MIYLSPPNVAFDPSTSLSVTDGDAIVMDKLPAPDAAPVRVSGDPPLTFAVDGVTTRTESNAPYCAYGDVDGNKPKPKPEAWTVGAHTVTSGGESVTFTLKAPEPPPPPPTTTLAVTGLRLADTATRKLLDALPNSGVINQDAPGADTLTIVADVNGPYSQVEYTVTDPNGLKYGPIRRGYKPPVPWGGDLFKGTAAPMPLTPGLWTIIARVASVWGGSLSEASAFTYTVKAPNPPPPPVVAGTPPAIPDPLPADAPTDTTLFASLNKLRPVAVLKRGWRYVLSSALNGILGGSITAEPGTGPLPEIRYSEIGNPFALSSASDGFVMSDVKIDMGDPGKTGIAVSVRGANVTLTNVWSRGGNGWIVVEGRDGAGHPLTHDVTIKGGGIYGKIGGNGIYTGASRQAGDVITNLRIKGVSLTKLTSSVNGFAHMMRFYSVDNLVIDGVYVDSRGSDAGETAAIRLHDVRNATVTNSVLLSDGPNDIGPLNKQDKLDPYTAEHVYLSDNTMGGPIYLSYGAYDIRLDRIHYRGGNYYPISIKRTKEMVKDPVTGKLVWTGNYVDWGKQSPSGSISNTDFYAEDPSGTVVGGDAGPAELARIPGTNNTLTNPKRNAGAVVNAPLTSSYKVAA